MNTSGYLMVVGCEIKIAMERQISYTAADHHGIEALLGSI
jgi:hypothetical protein